MKTYRGTKSGFHLPDGKGFSGVTVDGHKLNPRLRLRNHSPTGYNWGYGGSGPAQLALAILCDYLGNDEAAQRFYQDFKRDVIANLPEDEPWTLTGDEVEAALENIRTAET